jgi:hypothetical protein
MLDDVERRRFLVEPAREDTAPALVGALDVDLDEGAGQFLRFPRGRRLARAQPYDDVLPARRLAGMKHDVLDDAVALVEDAEHRDSLRHRRYAMLAATGAAPGRGRRGRILLLGAAVAAGKRERDQEQRGELAIHAYSGIHGS